MAHAQYLIINAHVWNLTNGVIVNDMLAITVWIIGYYKIEKCLLFIQSLISGGN